MSHRYVRIGVAGLFAILVTVLIGACGKSSSPSAPSPPPSPPPPGSTTVTIPSGASSLGSAAFGPNPLTVGVGTAVTWTNQDNVAHTSTANNGAWSSGTIAPGGQFRFTFQTAGTFPYRCTIHPGMMGSITVQ